MERPPLSSPKPLCVPCKTMVITPCAPLLRVVLMRSVSLPLESGPFCVSAPCNEAVNPDAKGSPVVLLCDGEDEEEVEDCEMLAALAVAPPASAFQPGRSGPASVKMTQPRANTPTSDARMG